MDVLDSSVIPRKLEILSVDATHRRYMKFPRGNDRRNDLELTWDGMKDKVRASGCKVTLRGPDAFDVYPEAVGRLLVERLGTYLNSPAHDQEHCVYVA